MPKKKIGRQVKQATVRKASSKSTPVKRAAAAKAVVRKALKPAKKVTVKKTTDKKATLRKTATLRDTSKAAPLQRSEVKRVPVKSPAGASLPTSHPEISLGRPLVTQEERLYMLFHDDFQARQVFEFLRVENVKELEQFSQQQIVHLMSKPLRMTVDRIRQRLAQYKRSLKDDEQFAADFLKHAEPKPN